MLTQGTTGYVQFNLATKNGPLNLTNCDVKLILKKNQIDAPITLDCQIDDDIGGICSITLTPTELNESGNYYYVLKITFPDTTVMKSEMSSMYVEESLG